ncbi:hypothetical protein LTR84_007505 [Exophiala bonariae]|uniref:Spindle pole body component n=1 Tax=Exophiala bonariae TaxID=1690606 RepID=A0AAV9MYD7_9EURO|nr:hypothetical protein LTR84_007505 [Exophiala bonariae]
MLLEHRDKGQASLQFLLRQLQQVPQRLEELYTEILRDITGKDVQSATRLFQWVLVARRARRLREWYHVLAFIRSEPPRSLRAWRASDGFIESDQQLEQQIRSISKGLVEVRWQNEIAISMQPGDEWNSMGARAGSMDSGKGDTRVVHFIHESVHEFFLKDGFSILDSKLQVHALGYAHLSVLETCVDYICLEEFSPLIEGRVEATCNASQLTGVSSYFGEWKNQLDPLLLDECYYQPYPASPSRTSPLRENRRRIWRSSMSVASFGSSASAYSGFGQRPFCDHQTAINDAMTRLILPPTKAQNNSAEPLGGPSDMELMLQRYLRDSSPPVLSNAIDQVRSPTAATPSLSGRSHTFEHFPHCYSMCRTCFSPMRLRLKKKVLMLATSSTACANQASGVVGSL